MEDHRFRRAGPSPAVIAIGLLVVIVAAAVGLSMLAGDRAEEAEPEETEQADPFEGMPPEFPDDR